MGEFEFRGGAENHDLQADLLENTRGGCRVVEVGKHGVLSLERIEEPQAVRHSDMSGQQQKRNRDGSSAKATAPPPQKKGNTECRAWLCFMRRQMDNRLTKRPSPSPPRTSQVQRRVNSFSWEFAGISSSFLAMQRQGIPMHACDFQTKIQENAAQLLTPSS